MTPILRHKFETIFLEFENRTRGPFLNFAGLYLFVYPGSCFHIHAELPQKIGNIQNKNIIKRSLPKCISSSQTPYMIFIDLMRLDVNYVDVDVCTVYVSSNCLCDKVITVQPYK